jgi:hypothetical protein
VINRSGAETWEETKQQLLNPTTMYWKCTLLICGVCELFFGFVQLPSLGHFGMILLKMKVTRKPCSLHLLVQIQDTPIHHSSPWIIKVKNNNTLLNLMKSATK